MPSPGGFARPAVPIGGPAPEAKRALNNARNKPPAPPKGLDVRAETVRAAPPVRRFKPAALAGVPDRLIHIAEVVTGRPERQMTVNRKPAEEEHGPSFTEITLDVHAEDQAPTFSGTRH